MDFRAGRSPDGSRHPSTFSDVSSAPLIRDGDMVVFFEGREPIGFDRMKPKTIWQCRHGAFHHDEIVGKPFGSRVFSRTTKGYVYVLSPTPELWSHVVPNRTQIVQDFDQSIVIFRLELKPGDTVVESGTGSGVMSTAIMRTIAPSGFLHSFEFNEIRATRAQEEFEENKLGGLAKVVHRDVCASRADGGGFGEELDGKADAVFLDLPEPWLAVEHAKLTLKPGRKLCSYSPCIEQVMKTCEALRSQGFHSVTTIEFRLRNINYTEVQLDVPDFGSNQAATAATAGAALSAASMSHVDNDTGAAAGGLNGEVEGRPVGVGVERDGTTEQETDGCGGGDRGMAVGEAKGASGVSGRDQSKASQEGRSGIGEDGAAAEGTSDNAGDSVATIGECSDPKDNGAPGGPVAGSNANKRPREEGGATNAVPEVEKQASRLGRGRNERLQPKAAIRAAEAAAERGGGRKPPLKLVCAQPFPLMRGHTAFLTFATAPVSRQLAGGTAAVAAAAAGEAAVTSEGDNRGSVDGEPNVTGCGASSGGSRSGDKMEVCEECEGDVKGMGKSIEAEKTDNAEEACISAVVSDTIDSSTPAGR